MADEGWQRDALDDCIRGLMQYEQLYSGFPGQLAATLLKNAGVLSGADVNKVKIATITKQTATLFEILKEKCANPNVVSALRKVLSSRPSLSGALQFLPQLEAPGITHQPGPSQTYCPLGQKVKLSCQATGKPAPELQWYVNGQFLADETGDTIEVDTPGNYMCRATNRVDSVDSISVAVAIVKSEAPHDVRNAGQDVINQYYLDNVLEAPPEIVAQGLLARKAFYNAIKSGGFVLFHQTRLMVVGQDRVGKTTWVQAIVEGKQELAEATSSTDGIEFTLIKCSLEDPECKFEIPDPDSEMEIIERAQARFIAEKIHKMDPTQKKEKEKLTAPQQVVQDPEGGDLQESPSNPDSDRTERQQLDRNMPFLEPAKQQMIEVHAVYPELTPQLTKLVGEELKKLQSSDLEAHTQTSDRFLILRISDFAGQPMHYNSHVFFLSDIGIYAMMFDLTRDLDDVAKVLVGAKGVETIVDSPGLDTNLDYFKTWMASITNTKQPSQQEGFRAPDCNPLCPSVVFIGTKLDEVYSKYVHLTTDELMTTITKKKKKILKELTGSKSGKWKSSHQTEGEPVLSLKDKEFSRNSAHLRDPMFFVDNFKKVPRSHREFTATRKKLVQLAMEQQATTRLTPFSWILYELELYKQKKLRRHLRKDEYAELAMKHNIRIEDIDEVLRYFDKQGVVVYRPDSLLLSDILIIDVDWLMKAFRSIIRIRQPAWKADSSCLWNKISETGIVSYSMLEDALKCEQLVSSTEELSLVIGLFQKFNLLVAYLQAHNQVTDYKSIDFHKKSDFRVSQFVAPSLVMNNPDWELFVPLKQLDPLKTAVKPIYIRSTTGVIPDALYNQLVTRCITGYPLCPEVYRYFARVHIDHRYDLLLFNCKPHQKEARLPHEQKEAKGTIMITVVDVDPVTQYGAVPVSSICNQVLNHVLWSIDDIKSTGLNGIQFTLETAVYDRSIPKWKFQSMSSLCEKHYSHTCPRALCPPRRCKLHQVEACASSKCFDQLFSIDYFKIKAIAGKKEECERHTLAAALIMWMSEHYVSESNKTECRPICQGCFYDVGMQNGYLMQPVVLSKSSPKRADKVDLVCEVQEDSPIIEWRHKGSVMTEKRGSKLEIQSCQDEDNGIYTCRVTTYRGDYAFSRPLLLSIPPKKELNVIQRVECMKRDRDKWVIGDCKPVLLEEPIRLRCVTDKGKELTYQWYFHGLQIPRATSDCYTIQSIQDYDDGQYVCKVRMDEDHDYEESQPVFLDLLAQRYQPVVTEMDRRKFFEFEKKTPREVSDKVALLIGNSTYEDSSVHKTLELPENDVRVVTRMLKTFGFQTISFVDLKFFEMVKALELFYSLVKPSVYAVVYYAGHGFEANREQYLLPVDADDRYDLRRAIRAKGISCQLQQCGAFLSLLILDCCRIVVETPYAKKKNELPALDIGAVITAASCCPSHKAYEAPSCANSVFTTALDEEVRALRPGTFTSIHDLLHGTKKRAEKRCDDLGIQNMYPTIEETNSSTISLSDLCKREGSIYEKNRKKIADNCHGLSRSIEPGAVTHSMRVEVTLEYGRAFSNVLVIRCKMRTLATSVSDMTAVFKLSDKDVDTLKKTTVLDGVVVQQQKHWMGGELEDHGRTVDHAGVYGPCLKVYGLQRARRGALAKLPLKVEVRYDLSLDGEIHQKRETVDFRISFSPLIAAAHWYG